MANEETKDRRKTSLSTNNIVPIITTLIASLISAVVAIYLSKGDVKKQSDQVILIKDLITAQNKVMDAYHDELIAIIQGVDYKITDHLADSRYMDYNKLNKIRTDFKVKSETIEKSIPKK